MSTTRIFTIAEVNELIPALGFVVGRQLSRRAEIESRLRALAELTGDVPNEIALDPKDSPEVRRQKSELAGKVHEYQAGWQEVEAMGGVLKDSRAGLVDFYGRVDDTLVWLCWKYGETEVTHFHALDEGFTARKEIRTSIRTRLLN
ncbi:MAG: DUF2203 domain-containing protein [Polyangiaceae bacterium]